LFLHHQALTRPTFYVVLVTSADCGLHAGNMKISAQNKYWINVFKIVRIILPVWFYVHYSTVGGKKLVVASFGLLFLTWWRK